jgi:hypothetical protein
MLRARRATLLATIVDPRHAASNVRRNSYRRRRILVRATVGVRGEEEEEERGAWKFVAHSSRICAQRLNSGAAPSSSSAPPSPPPPSPLASKRSAEASSNAHAPDAMQSSSVGGHAASASSAAFWRARRFARRVAAVGATTASPTGGRSGPF